MSDLKADADIPATGPPDLLGDLGSSRRRLDELTRDSAAESLAATADAVRDAKTEERDHAEALETVETTRTDAVDAARRRRTEGIASARRTHEERHLEIDQEAEAMSVRIRRKAHENERKAKEALEEAVWLADTVYEANEKRPAREFEERAVEIDEDVTRLEELESRMMRETRRYKQPVPRAAELDAADLREVESKPQVVMKLELGAAAQSTETFRRLALPRLFRGPIMVLPLAAFFGAGVGVAAATGATERGPLVEGGLYGLLAFVPVLAILYVFARRTVVRAWRPFARSSALVRKATERSKTEAREEMARLEARLIATRDRETAEAEAKYQPIIAENLAKAKERVAELERRVPIQKAEADATLETATATAESEADAMERDAVEAHAAALAAEHDRHRAAVETLKVAAEDRWTALERGWFEGLDRHVGRLTEIRDDLAGRFPDFTDPGWKTWSPPGVAPPAITLGRLRFDRTAVEGGPPADPRLATDHPTTFDLPSMISLPSRASLQIDVDPDHRTEGLELLRAAMLRILATVPPGKARFTILDPVGLGQNFAGFMHLEDELPGLVGERIWTEPRQIEQKLTDITEHMETVIQKYLRNEFESIDAYNLAAGEIAEPYRFLVISDFPANFNDESARRLASILQSGPRCGVFTLILRDRRGEVPEKFDVADIDRETVTIRSTRNGMRFEAEGLEDLDFEPATGPPDDLLIEMAHRVGRAALDAGKVEVPFETIAPPREKFWTGSTEKKVSVALGRAGATRLQTIELGVGTAQHALVAGKTGSGKSTLLHAFITNLACWYSPDEVEFYLVDFKKGVEFKTYAQHELPHARVIAIESDREFGLSVLQRIDQELKERGERFRDLGVQDLAAFRASTGESLPRMLLVIDEFQELFVDDDKLSQDASLLLDRLVRQGRAFGIHALLGSQTLDGAYSLARSTLGQMGVRIALQCTEADSYLILSEENAAARLLERPGEAIYNDAGGKVEGNNPFQVCWLDDDVRDDALGLVQALSRKHKLNTPAPFIFEGNIPADLSECTQLNEVLAAAPSNKGQLTGWLGDAIAIKDPTAFTLQSHSGSNVLVVGQREEAATAQFLALMLGMASQQDAPQNCDEHGVCFYVLDGLPADSSNAGKLAALGEQLPHRVVSGTHRDTEAILNELGALLGRRRDEGADEGARIILFLHGLQRLRDLRRDEDDFSFSSGDDDSPAKPDQILAELLKDGPAYGIHVLTWVDTLNNLNRTLDRNGQREFEMRVLFQMSANDSSHLIDSPVASNLGLQRALYNSEDTGIQEKFRPWAMPDDIWMDQQIAKLRDRG
ncbi:MAG: FtsK/SpoIIIE domain-containing protein [Phycisphaerales bacterium]|nr:FtsK/SpoIIIE domain-containing protein [Phycisphaerales bacterium]